MQKRLSLGVLVVALVVASCSNSGGDRDTSTTAARGSHNTTTTTGSDDGTNDTTTTTSGDDGTNDTTTTTSSVGDTGGESDAVVTDVGVDLNSKTIRIGVLASLSGLFAASATDITDAQRVYWDNVNTAGGIEGWTVELVIEDTAYIVEQHLEKYLEIRNDVVAISESSGSPANLATLDKYKEDSMLVIPLSWYSGWAIPEFDGGVMLEQNTNYCIEAMNILDFINEMGGKTIALVTFPGDYGGDNAAGVKKAVDFYGMELVFDGEGAVIPGQDQTAVIQGIVGSGADWTYMATNPSMAAEILRGTTRAGHTGLFTGSAPTFDFRLLDSPEGPLFDEVYYQSAYNVGWGTDTPGNNEMMAALTEAFPDRRPSDAFIIGWNEAITMHKVLATAIAAGDLTREGVVAAANSITDVDFRGTAPNQSYAGTPNEYVQRTHVMFDPDLATYIAAGGDEQTLSQEGGTTGSLLAKDFWVGAMAEAYVFTSPCFEL